jgi:cellulose synthase/poly-beta-1,6-N-acetylglucosamine synthase-like glycosyltransferase
VYVLAVAGAGWQTLLGFFVATQVVYFGCIVVMGYFYTRPADLVLPTDAALDDVPCPPVLLLYPVLRELEATMRTTFLAIDVIDYPRDRFRVVAIPNVGDDSTIASLERLQLEFPWLEVMPVPPTTDPTWDVVWERWEGNEKAYWWHVGKRARVRDLPPKKTRQLVYAFYNICPPDGTEVLVSYIDADSAPPPNYFKLGAAGVVDYDVVQLTNVAGNVLASWATSYHGFDHMCWDASVYQHMSAHGKHPFYVLGKGLFFKSTDLHDFGGFHPWLTIEDPEVGMRLWTNGRRLGVVPQPLVEEVPLTFGQGITQRKRWVCGFFQSLGKPLALMGMSASQRFRARLNLVPCLSLLVNPIGLAVGLWILVLAITGDNSVGIPITVLAGFNVVAAAAIIIHNWINSWRVSRLVLDARRSRLLLAFRLNPLFVMLYWLFWVVAIVIGIQMFIRDKGLVWERTEKIDANHDLVRGLELASASSSASSVGTSSSAGSGTSSSSPSGNSGTPVGTRRSDATRIDLHQVARAIAASADVPPDRPPRPSRVNRHPRALPDLGSPALWPLAPGWG